MRDSIATVAALDMELVIIPLESGLNNLKIIEMSEKELEKFGKFLESLSEDEIDSLIELMEFNAEIDEAMDIYNEEREGWLDYSAEPFSEELEKKLESMYHYENSYKS